MTSIIYTRSDFGSLRFPPRADRRISEKTDPIWGRNVRYDVNGNGFDFSSDGRDKWSIQHAIEGAWAGPSLDDVIDGGPVTISLIGERTHSIAPGTTTLTIRRDAVADSLRILKPDFSEVPSAQWSLVGRLLTMTAQAERVSVFYRPKIQAILESWSNDIPDEWNACRVSTTLSWKEI